MVLRKGRPIVFHLARSSGECYGPEGMLKQKGKRREAEALRRARTYSSHGRSGEEGALWETGRQHSRWMAGLTAQQDSATENRTRPLRQHARLRCRMSGFAETDDEKGKSCCESAAGGSSRLRKREPDEREAGVQRLH